MGSAIYSRWCLLQEWKYCGEGSGSTCCCCLKEKAWPLRSVGCHECLWHQSCTLPFSSQADFIWANDACRFLAPTIFQSLSLLPLLLHPWLIVPLPWDLHKRKIILLLAMPVWDLWYHLNYHLLRLRFLLRNLRNKILKSCLLLKSGTCHHPLAYYQTQEANGLDS